MALGIGSVVLGVAISYCLHVIVHQRFVRSVEQMLAEEAKPVCLGCLTTVGAFLGLLFTQSELLKDFGLFATFALVGSTFFALIFLPHFLREEDVKRNELVFKGIHVASYGLDLKCTNLIDIVKKVNETEGIERIRFSSMEPTAVTEEFVDEMKKMPKICDHFPLSLQSGCDRTLKAMNRRYTADEYALAVDRLRAAFPDVAITTDIIVGFPGETEEDFLESIAFARRVGLSKIHVFPYSPKTGTPAAKMKEQVPPDIKNDRASRLIAVSDELNKKFIDTLKGRTMPVLFEIRNKDGYFEGHTTNYIKVLVKTEEDLKNQILNVKIGEYCGDETVYGEI